MAVSWKLEHGVRVEDAIDIEENSGATLSFSAVATQTGALAEGIYDISPTQNCFIKIAQTADDVTTSNGYRLLANNVVSVKIRAGSKIGAIRDTADGTLYYHLVG